MKSIGKQTAALRILDLAAELLQVQNLMPISADDRARLKNDIDRNGIRDALKVYRGEDGRFKVLAGATRLAIAGELNQQTVPIEIFDAPRKERQAFAIEENLARRHLSASQKTALVRYLIGERPELSDRVIAAKTGASPTTVGKVRKAQVSRMDTGGKRIGKDGKKQAATKRKTNSRQNEKQRLKIEIKHTQTQIEKLETQIKAKRHTLNLLKKALQKENR